MPLIALTNLETLLATLLVVLAAATLIGAWMIRRAIHDLRWAADRLAKGDLTPRVAVRGPYQLAKLGAALNRMSRLLSERLQAVSRQRNELDAVLSSMVEGVIAFDREERILSLNRAAARMMQLDAERAIGRPVQEAIRNAALQRFVTEALGQHGPIEREFTLRAGTVTTAEPRDVQAQSAVLRDADGQRLGVVVVLHDVTRLRRLESMRQDFVANVSHEVKTPVSAIKTAVETLLDGGEHDRADAERFMRIIARQADRLNAIVDDLLSLARIEQDEGRMSAERDRGRLAPVLTAACETCQGKADAKRIRLHMRCGAELTARLNAPLLEQAVVNLIDNAIKYSPSGTTVEVVGRGEGEEVVIAVRDEGRGIEAEHLPRIFERFYRTDKARSRDLGGTGLGLSIVKHIAQAHGGRVGVESVPGRGSTFTIHLPAVEPEPT